MIYYEGYSICFEPWLQILGVLIRAGLTVVEALGQPVLGGP